MRQRRGYFRRIIVVLGVCMLTMGVQARTYRHSIGGNAGSVYGVSYKGFVFPEVKGLAIQADLGVKLLAVPIAVENWVGQSFTTSWSCYTFELNLNLLYQSLITEFDEGRVDWYAGGGLSLGLMRDMTVTYDEIDPTLGKFGINAVAGVELLFDEVPVNLSFDFRPGYGVNFIKGHHLSFFDWALAIGVRYRF